MPASVLDKTIATRRAAGPDGTLAADPKRGDTRHVESTSDAAGAAQPFEAAVPAGEDPVRYARVLREIRDAALSGRRSPAAPRSLVTDSWRRTLGFGMDPDRGRDLPEAAGPAEVEYRRHTGKLARVLPVLGDVLLPAAEDAGHVMVVVDAHGMVLWRDGPNKIQQHAERLGFSARAAQHVEADPAGGPVVPRWQPAPIPALFALPGPAVEGPNGGNPDAGIWPAGGPPRSLISWSVHGLCPHRNNIPIPGITSLETR